MVKQKRIFFKKKKKKEKKKKKQNQVGIKVDGDSLRDKHGAAHSHVLTPSTQGKS